MSVMSNKMPTEFSMTAGRLFMLIMSISAKANKAYKMGNTYQNLIITSFNAVKNDFLSILSSFLRIHNI